MTPTQSGQVEAGGARYGYEIHGVPGAGPPVLLLHGGFGAIETMAPLMQALTARHQVIGVDLYGHGRTALTDRPIDPIAIADDLAVIIRALAGPLGFEQVDAVGFSFGGMVALRLAIQHPALVRRLVVASAPFSDTGFFEDLRPQREAITRQSAAMFMHSPMFEAYKAVAPRLEDFPELVHRMGEAIRTRYDWSEEVRGLQPPTLLVFGDSDGYTPEHVIRFYQLLGGGLRDPGWDGSGKVRHRLAILPGVTHYDLSDSPGLAAATLAFLEAGA